MSFTLLVLLPVAAVSAASAFIQYSSGEQQTIDRLDAVTNVKKSQLDAWLSFMENDLESALEGGNHVWFASVVLQKAKHQVLLWNGAYKRVADKIKETLENSDRFDEIFLLNVRGEVVLSTNNAREGENYAEHLFFTKALQGGRGVQVGASGLAQSGDDQAETSVVLGAPLMNKKGITLGVVCGRADSSPLNSIMLERSGLGRTGATYLVDAQGRALTRAPTPVGSLADAQSIRDAALKRIDFGGRFSTDGGKKMVGAFSWLPKLNSMLVAEQEQREAYAPIYTALKANILVALVALVLAVILALLITRNLTRPLADLAHTAAQIADGEHKIKAAEGGVDEINNLAVAFNTMTTKLHQVIRGLRNEVAERKRAEKALRQSEERFRGLVENIPGVTYRCTLQDALAPGEGKNQGRAFSTLREKWKVQFISDDIAPLTGYPAADFLAENGRTLLSITHPNDQSYVTGGIQERLRTGGSFNLEYRIVQKGGGDCWVLDRGRVLLGAGHGEVFIEGVVLDISEQKQAAAQLANLNRRLEERVMERTKELTDKTLELESVNKQLKEVDELKSLFLTSVTHDIRTPLTSVLGFAKLVKRNFEKFFLPLARQNESLESKGEKLAENLRIILDEGERLSRMVNDFLDLSKIESGRMEWKDEQVPPAELVDTALRVMRGELDTKSGAQLSLSMEYDLPMLFVDPDRVVQVLINLLHNALKFTDDGVVKLSVAPRGDMVAFSVSDTGVGIPQDALEHIFEKFHQYRHDDDVSHRHRGSGMGLAICKHIVDHYGGAFEVQSELGKGSVFTFMLPAFHFNI